jgi:hypothetical protein
MRFKSITAGLIAATMVGGTLATPLTANAQSSLDRESQRRQKTKNEWRNIGIGSGAVALYGLLKGDKTLMFGGAAGALYSLNRYEQDRKSQSKTDRARAAAFDRASFTRDGKRYVRKTVTKNGKKYYQFVRAK